MQTLQIVKGRRSLKKAEPVQESEVVEKVVPIRWRKPIVLIALAHLFVLLACWTSSYRLSSLGMDMLSFLSPYTVSTNVRVDYMPLAVTNPSELESPIDVEFKVAGSQQWVRWMPASQTNQRTGTSKVRQRRYLNQVAGLMEVQSEDGIAMVVAAMLNDLESKLDGKSYDQVRVVQKPLIRQDEWQIAERFIQEGNLPDALAPEVMLAANIVRLPGGSIGILSQEEAYRTAPVVPAAVKSE